MMPMMLIKKTQSSYFSCFIGKSLSLSKLSLYSTSTSEKLPQTSNFMRDYLISTCEFSSTKATTASKGISYIHTPEKPDSVIQFLKQNGFSNEHVRKTIANCPTICGRDVEKVISPNFQALRNLGFKNQELIKFISSSPHTLCLPRATTRIEYWKNLLGNDLNKLLLAFTRNRGLTCLDIDKNVIPKISLLQNSGFTKKDIRIAITMLPGFITMSLDLMEKTLNRSLKFGFIKGSKMYLNFLLVAGRFDDDGYKGMVEFYRNFGWSESDFLSAMLKQPRFLNISKEITKAKMEYLTKCVGCTQSYIASHPVLLTLSLTNRLAPRSKLIKILKSSVLNFKETDLFTIMALSEKKFKEKYILQFKDEVPKLMETYNSLCSHQISD